MKRFFTLLFAASCLTAVGQVPDYVPTEGLVGWWPLDNSASNVWSNEHQGSIDAISNAVLEVGQNRFGQPEACLDFSGNVSRVTIPHSEALSLGRDNANAITYALWFRRTTNPSNSDDEILLTKGTGGNSATRDYRFWHENNPNSINEGLVEITGDGSYDCTLHHFGVLEDDDWHHLVVASSNAGDGQNGTKVVWLDAVLIDSCSYEVKGPSNTGPLYIGGEPGYSNFLGLIDDVGVWSRALSSSEVEVLYNWIPLPGCTDAEACNFNADALVDDGSCYSCDIPASHCGPGTIWDAELQMCIGDGSGDINLDGCVQLNDLLDLLSAYGNCGTWQCGDPLEYQGYDYATVQIGEQCWFAENLRAENYSNGDPVQSDLSSSDWVASTEGASAVYGESGSCEDSAPDFDACDSSIALAIYGRLYNWYAVDDERSLCPNDWHVPTDNEWMDLEIEIGMAEGEAMQTNCRGDVQGNVLKTTTGWNGGGNGTDVWGFSANPVGYRDQIGQFQDGGDEGHWWTADSHNQSNAWYRGIASWDGGVCRNPNPKKLGFAVRCLKD